MAVAKVLSSSDFRALVKMARKSTHTGGCEKSLFVESVAQTNLFVCVEWLRRPLLLKS